ncbi:MAG: helix-turn-helix domain-containing protein [Defluviitaleaceae bacterium]|nr:helix-turn-helix domain-containing protein [Defluviitaleaceae bacterium]
MLCKAEVRTQICKYLGEGIIEAYVNGDFVLHLQVPDDERMWLAMLLSFGDKVEVLEPESLRIRLSEIAKNILSLYCQRGSMKTSRADIIKSIRKEMGLSQEEMAEQLFVSVRHLARIEAGEASINVWQFITTLELLGSPTEDFWLLYLDSSEYASYRDYRRLKRQLGNDDWIEAKNIIDDIEKGSLIKQPIVEQFVAYVKVIIEMTVPSAETIEALTKTIRISKPRFEEDKISEYRMSYNEIYIALSIAECLNTLGEQDRAISIVQSIINSRENSKVSEEDKITIFPSLYFTLSRLLRSVGRYKEALKACDYAVEISREYNNLRRIPEMLFCMADCYHKLGEEEQIYKTHLIRAYHTAYGMGRNDAATTIKEDALKYYGVIVP